MDPTSIVPFEVSQHQIIVDRICSIILMSAYVSISSQSMATIVEHKAKCRLEAIPIDWNLANESRVGNKCAKYIPIKTTRLIRTMYGQKCREHTHTTNGRHLREEHQISIDPMELIDRYQQKRYRKNMLFEMKDQLLRISTIAEIVRIGDEVLRKGKRRRQHQ
jgi:hypothetical protein